MTTEELNKQIEKYESIRDSHVQLLNDSETEAVKQLILVATVFLTASLFVLQKDNLGITLNLVFKIILLFSWFSFVSSMGFGVSIFIRDRKFFNDWAAAAELTSNAITKKIVDNQENISNLAIINFSKLSENTSDTLLKLQIFSLAFGIVGLLIVSSVFIL